MAPPEEEPILVSAIAQYAYCPRRCALIHLEQTFEDNVYTLQGSALHDRADEPLTTWEPGKRIERAMPIWSESLGLVGRADTVEFGDDGSVRPVEYKRGPRAPKRHDDLQLCAQALCLEEMLGVRVSEGAIFYHASRRSRRVVFDDALRRDTLATIEAVRKLFRSPVLPPPLNDEHCPNCSLVDACLPEALAAVDQDEDDPAALFRPIPYEDE